MGLAPALWAHGRRLQWWHPVPTDAAVLIAGRAEEGHLQPTLALQQAYDANVARNRDLLDQGEFIEGAFRASGIDSVRLKGWHTLTNGWWADVGERTMTDLDVLVPVDRIGQATAVLDQLGYQPIASGHTDAADHELAPVHLPGRLGSVEIHRALAVSRWADVLSASEVIAGPRPMSTTDAVTHLIVHAQLHDEAHLLGTVPWRALYEFSLVAPRVELEHIRARFSRHGAQDAFDGFVWLSTELFGASVADEVRSVPWRTRAARAMIDRPAIRSQFARAAYAPRALSSDRMRSIDPESAPWVTRLRRVTARTGRFGAAAGR